MSASWPVLNGCKRLQRSRRSASKRSFGIVWVGAVGVAKQVAPFVPLLLLVWTGWPTEHDTRHVPKEPSKPEVDSVLQTLAP